MSKPWMVFDVESIGLHGEGYAVGYVVLDADGREVDSGRFACDPLTVEGSPEGRAWVDANIAPIEVTHCGPHAVRHAFWSKWREWADKGAQLVADCGWPVEARFMRDCVTDQPAEREWKGPYPMHDLASICYAKGRDPLMSNDRMPDELPVHDPLADARQSARLLREALFTPAARAGEENQ